MTITARSRPADFTAGRSRFAGAAWRVVDRPDVPPPAIPGGTEAAEVSAIPAGAVHR